MAGIIAVYGLVIAVLIAGALKPPPASYSLFQYALRPPFAIPLRYPRLANDFDTEDLCTWQPVCLWV